MDKGEPREINKRKWHNKLKRKFNFSRTIIYCNNQNRTKTMQNMYQNSNRQSVPSNIGTANAMPFGFVQDFEYSDKKEKRQSVMSVYADRR